MRVVECRLPREGRVMNEKEEKKRGFVNAVSNIVAVVLLLCLVAGFCAGCAYGSLWIAGHDPYCPIAWGGAGLMYFLFLLCLRMAAIQRHTVSTSTTQADEEERGSI